MVSSNSVKNLDIHRVKSAAKDSDKIVEAEIGSVHEVSWVQQATYQDEDEMEFMLEKLLKEQQEMTEHLNLKLDFQCKDLNGRLETLDSHVKMLRTQVYQTAEAVKQGALVKKKAVESERHQVDDILDIGFEKILEQEKLEEDAFQVESSMSIGSSYWCRPTPTPEHRSTSSPERRPTQSDMHRSTPLLESDKFVRIQNHSDFAAQHPHPPTLLRVKTAAVDRQQQGNIDRQEKQNIDRHPPMPCRVSLPDLDAHRLKATRNPSQTSVFFNTREKMNQQSAEAPKQGKSTLAETSFVENVDRRHTPGIDRHQWDGYETAIESQVTKDEIPVEMRVKSRKPYIPKHLRREINKVELDGFHKRVKRVPKDMSFEEAYYKYRLGNFFRESRETDKDIELLFNKVCRKPNRTLKKEQDPGKFLIPCCIHNHELPTALCDTGSAVSIMAIDTAEVIGLKVEPSKDSFTFADNSRVDSAGIIRNVKVEIGDCTIPVDFHVMEIKPGTKNSLLFGRAFMATVGAVCDLKKNRMCLTNVDETVFYDPLEKKTDEKFISCIEMFEDPAPKDGSNRESAKPESTSIDNHHSASVDKQPSESIDTKPSASIDTLCISEQTETEKSKSGGRTRSRKKKKKRNADADFLSLVPSQGQEGSLEYKVRCRGSSEPFAKVRVLCDPELRDKGEVSARAFTNYINKMRKRDTETCFGASSHLHPD